MTTPEMSALRDAWVRFQTQNSRAAPLYAAFASARPQIPERELALIKSGAVYAGPEDDFDEGDLCFAWCAVEFDSGG